MIRQILLIITAVILTSCSEHKLQIPPEYDVSYEETIQAVNSLYIGMTVQEMMGHMIPVMPDHPYYKKLKNGNLEYHFALGLDLQFRVEMRFDKNIKNYSPSLPNGIVTKIGQLEKRTEWVRMYEDSLQIK
jgi:hypothetical protein